MSKKETRANSLLNQINKIKKGTVAFTQLKKVYYNPSIIYQSWVAL